MKQEAFKTFIGGGFLQENKPNKKISTRIMWDETVQIVSPKIHTHNVTRNDWNNLRKKGYK